LDTAPGCPSANVPERTTTDRNGSRYRSGWRRLTPNTGRRGPLVPPGGPCGSLAPVTVGRTQGRVCCRTWSKPSLRCRLLSGRQRSSMSLRCQSPLRAVRAFGLHPLWHVPPSGTYRSGLVHLVALGDGQHLGFGATVEDRVGRLFGAERFQATPLGYPLGFGDVGGGRRGRPDRTDLAAGSGPRVRNESVLSVSVSGRWIW
jgi:hypothetical protein